MLFILTLFLILQYHVSQATYVVAWGSNTYGQLGIGNTSDATIPVVVGDYTKMSISNIRVGLATHFAMMGDGSVWACGNNMYGQLGLNHLVSQSRPVNNSLAYGMDVSPIGPQTIAYSSSTKTVWGWGTDAGNMLGSSFSGSQQTPIRSTNPDFAGTVTGINPAWSAAFVLLNSGTYAAGKLSNLNGYNIDSDAKLGVNSPNDQPDFVRMAFWDDVPLQRLFSTSSSHVCGLAKNQSLYCWGTNNAGQLGLNHTSDMGIPTRVSFFDDNQMYVAQLKTGDAHTIVLTCGGKVFSWGSNLHGNLGLGSKDALAHPYPALVSTLSPLNIIEITTAMNSVFARNSTNDWHVWGAATSNITLMPLTGDQLIPVVNPYFKQNALTHIATNSKSNFALAWVDPNVRTQISSSCPTLIDECAMGIANCAPNTQCVDTERAYKCVCGSGFTGDGISVEAGGTGCNDVNECTMNLCVPLASCVNQLGSFACPCPTGYGGDGYAYGSGCNDIDECKEGGYCPPNTDCTNSIGNYSCSCTAGFRYIGATPCGPVCTDIDECNTQNPCGPGSYCTNTAGGYSCSCSPGYSGASCTDINECTTGKNNCASQSYCVNTAGGYTCQCPSGFTGNGVSTASGGTGCSDINECVTSNSCNVNATCTNTPGSYSCTCNSGFSGDGRTCTDINECLNNNQNNCVPSSSYGTCSNTIGSYQCGCASGFSGNGVQTSSGGTGCTDINECSGQNNCSSLASCSNTVGSYACTCPNGYLGSGNSCYTVNCTIGTYPNTSTTCAPCPAGSYNNASNVETCVQCPAGTYSSGTGKTSISTCVACPQYTYSSVGSSKCSTCPPGTTSTGGSATCSMCPAGQYGLQGSCRNCGSGFYSTTAGAADCLPCTPGTYNSSTTPTSCALCPAGTISSGRASACTACPVGKYAAAGQYYCNSCPPGTSTLGLTGAAACTPCATGTYASTAASSQCAPCPTGTYTAGSGSDSCLSCAPGTYQNLTGQASCKPCNNWQFSDVNGATTCGTCYQGYAGEYEYGSRNCIACPPGTYRTNELPVCLPCYAGSANQLAGQPHCSLCMGGFYAKKCGLQTCDVCSPGTFSLYMATGQISCPFCPYGQESFGTAYFCYI